MPIANVFSRARLGLHAPEVSVEVHSAGGLPKFSLVGLPEAAVRESRDRVRSAIVNSGFDFPDGRLTVNLAPADLPKEGGRFDLPIAIGVLVATGQLPASALDKLELLGELGLAGDLRRTVGALPACLGAKRAGRTAVVPLENSDEAAIAFEADVLVAGHLLEVCAHVQGHTPLARAAFTATPKRSEYEADLSDVRGQPMAKRALEVSAAGGHNLLLIGPPGTGKTMLATRLPTLLPDLTEEQALETASVYSVCSLDIDVERWRQRPFRAPHHTSSAVALVGGGSNPRPGEISLAQHGVLFLDELTEFDRRVLEVLREPLESRHIQISRAAGKVRFPADFQLVAAMNPCPCGWLGDASGRCHCNPHQVQRYRSRISGPLLDRIDLHIEVPPLAPKHLFDSPVNPGESSLEVRARVSGARARQLARAGKLNRDLSVREMDRDSRLHSSDRELLRRAIDRFALSARAWHRILRVARTIADLEAEKDIGTPHLSEAIGYRSFQTG